ncbi:MAG: cell surface protein SprA [Fermentimonas sp.]|nr:cell surface protein SprA [Fermentimonas sp.]
MQREAVFASTTNSDIVEKDSLYNPLVKLQSPSYIQTTVRYDFLTKSYVLEKRIGSTLLSEPVYMSFDEYKRYRQQQIQTDFFRERNSLTYDHSLAPQRYQLPQRKKKRDPLESFFGPGGVKVTTNGYINVGAGLKRNIINNPTLPQRARKRTIFEFNQDIDINMNAKVGEKINFDINYDSEAGFDMDSKQIKLGYTGNEEDIIKNIEAGNVSMTTSNTLINVGTALFGVKSDLQFGNLYINTIFSQQQSESQTVTSSGGVNTTPFAFNADEYAANQHFFLGHYFRDAYDKAMSKLPFVQSRISITRMEVWVTNRRGNYEQVHDIVALADLGEHEKIHNPLWVSQGTGEVTHNGANSMYSQLISAYSGARNISDVANALPTSMTQGADYEKLENARLLNSTEYKYQPQLGYISLRIPLQDDEVLAVAFEFTYNGDVYQVGEFTNDSDSESSGALFVKLLKPASLSPYSPVWDLMMKNIYALGYGVYEVQKEKFKLDITYQSDSAGVYLNYLPEQAAGDEQLLSVMNLDRLNGRGDPYPDGIFDFLEGYTVDTEYGNIIFPVAEPFGSHLRQKIDNDAMSSRYVFQELYDSTLTIARQIPERNKFRLSGEYRGSSESQINLNVMNIARGSVRATAAGVVLTEGVDYSVDYMMGTVTILNRQLIDSGTPVSVTIENRPIMQTQRKTLMGINLLYDINKNLSVGGTLMHYYEKPLIVKTAFGDEASKNTLWGVNMQYRKQSYVLTNLLDMLPFVEASVPSELTANLEFAQMLPGHYKNKYTGAYSYLDDFESSAQGIDIRSPYSWTLASTPYSSSPNALFPEAALSNNTDYGKNRAQMAWFYIDGIFTRRNSSLTPAHIKNDPDQLSDHLVREVLEREIFPDRDAYYGLPATIPVLNISFYPDERGPYNLDTDVDSDGRLLNPSGRWGGITRRMDIRDFESANVEYIEFWLMDPFVNDSLGTSRGGDLYFNLGDISEDVLKDGKKFFENGLPLDGDTTAVGHTVWGKYPKRQSTVYAFDNSEGMEARRIQDVGLNGLSSEEEKVYPTYSRYLEELKPRLSGVTISSMEEDPHSPLNDPSGDSFRHYRGSDQDRRQLSILERYKYFNGTEGNSLAAEDDGFTGASRNTPDVEDINGDNTLNEHESYYQYKVSLRPEDMFAGNNYITDSREVTVRLRNGSNSKVTWYQFKIPVREYESVTGNIRGFNNIRFMRMFLTNFEEPVFLRFATLELVRSEWRTYRRDLVSGGDLSGSGNIDISTVNIEENGSRTPVNYLLPPGVNRIIDPGQPQLRQENEQSMALKITNLEPGDSRSVYRNTAYDMRRYKRLQMFVHAEQLTEDPTLEDADLSVFIRLGSDYMNNYYEYETPLKITPEGQYSSHSDEDREKVWPSANMFNFPLELFTTLKSDRNMAEHEGSGGDSFRRFTRPDPEKPENVVSITGNPSLEEVKVMMIGVRNRSDANKSAEVWVNELRLSEFDEKGGWAAQANINLALSDIGNINISGRKETAGFGALDQSLLQRRNDDYSAFNLAINLQLGRFLPKQAMLSAPLYYSYSNQLSAPMYDPFNKDILLSESLKLSDNQLFADSIRNIALTTWTNKSLSLSNVHFNIKSGRPMPYDPVNFRFSYANSVNRQRSPDTEFATIKDWRLLGEYNYTPLVKPWQPFTGSKYFNWVNFNFAPNSIRLSSSLFRNYQEIQLRDLTHTTTEAQNKFLTFSRNFFWDRDFAFTWDMTRNLRFSFRSGTLAEIEEPYLQVNRQINRSDYDIWKDSVMQSIADLGRPLNYEQSADITYTLPFANIPFLNWINSSVAYNSRYRWERGAYIPDATIGNFLQNDLSLTLNSVFNFAAIYRKSPLKNINVNLGFKTRTDLPGYIPDIGDAFGQSSEAGVLQPGLAFAFGMDGGMDFVRRSLSKNLLVINEENITPALFNETGNLRMEAVIEPVKGLIINLNVLYEDNRRTEMQYMVEGMPIIHGGSFAMTTMALSSYSSSAFEEFLKNRENIAARVQGQYDKLNPELRDGGNSGTSDFDVSKGTNFTNNISSPLVKSNSADVLIPAFLAAYTGKDPDKIGLTAFPDLSSLLPNWNITYNLLNMIPVLENQFKSLSLNHRYLSQYRVGSYSSFLSWKPATDDSKSNLGYIPDPVSGTLIATSPFDIPAVSILESFNPLIEAQSVLYNDVSLNVRLNKTRSLNLNIASNRIVETSDNDVTVGLGYRLAKLTTRLDLSHKSTKSLVRKIEDGFTQITSGLKSTSIYFTADYALSKTMTLRAFYERMQHKPTVSSNSYPTTNSNAGISVRLNLNQ